MITAVHIDGGDTAIGRFDYIQALDAGYAHTEALAEVNIRIGIFGQGQGLDLGPGRNIENAGFRINGRALPIGAAGRGWQAQAATGAIWRIRQRRG